MNKDMLKTPRPIRTAAPFFRPTALPVAVGGSRGGGESYRPPPSGKFALVLVDSPTMQKIIGMILRREGYEVQFFRNGIEAMQWFAYPEARTPDLMLVDLGLPKINGYDIIQKFKAKPRFARTACIILSSRTDRVDKYKGRIAGATAYITKPFTSQELMTTVHTSLSRI